MPITSSRDNIIQDSDEYKIFFNKMRENVREVVQYAKNFAFQRENTQASLVLRDALDKIGRAVKKNPDVFENNLSEPPLGTTALSDAGSEEGYEISKAQIIDTDLNPAFPETAMADNNIQQKPVKRRHLSLANRAVIRKMHFRNLGIVCRMERFGFAYPPSFVEQGIIYINIDHPLYRKQIDNSSSLTMFIATLITKELAVQKYPHDTSLAYNLQTQLLTDAFKDVRKL